MHPDPTFQPSMNTHRGAHVYAHGIVIHRVAERHPNTIVMPNPMMDACSPGGSPVCRRFS
jgi:hypothetical protein